MRFGVLDSYGFLILVYIKGLLLDSKHECAIVSYCKCLFLAGMRLLCDLRIKIVGTIKFRIMQEM